LEDRADCLEILAICPPFLRGHIMSELWIINGMLDYGLDSDLLVECINRHRKAGIYPPLNDYSAEWLFPPL